jgi:hypothetical protein
MAKFLLRLNILRIQARKGTVLLGEFSCSTHLAQANQFRPVDVSLPTTWEKGSKEIIEDVVKFGVRLGHINHYFLYADRFVGADQPRHQFGKPYWGWYGSRV